MSETCALFLLPVSQDPRPGQRVMVHLKSGEAIECVATRITSKDGTFTQYYHNRKSVDINQIAGWTATP
jgi:hypothetical protein